MNVLILNQQTHKEMLVDVVEFREYNFFDAILLGSFKMRFKWEYDRYVHDHFGLRFESRVINDE